MKQPAPPGSNKKGKGCDNIPSLRPQPRRLVVINFCLLGNKNNQKYDKFLYYKRGFQDYEDHFGSVYYCMYPGR